MLVRAFLAVTLVDGAAGSWRPAEAAGPAVEGTIKIVTREGGDKGRHDGVVVFLDGLERPGSSRPPTTHAVIRQQHKQFIPEVLPIVAGTTVDFPNEDSIYHNVFSLSKVTPFDLGLYAQDGTKSVTFDRPGLVKIYCNIHPQMIAYLLVLGNPYFTVTDAQGRFVIPDAPLGSATLRTWYSRSQEHPERTIQVTPQGVKDLNLQLVESITLQIKEESVSIEHKNKWGQDYPAKY